MLALTICIINKLIMLKYRRRLPTHTCGSPTTLCSTPFGLCEFIVIHIDHLHTHLQQPSRSMKGITLKPPADTPISRRCRSSGEQPSLRARMATEDWSWVRRSQGGRAGCAGRGVRSDSSAAAASASAWSSVSLWEASEGLMLAYL